MHCPRAAGAGIQLTGEGESEQGAQGCSCGAEVLPLAWPPAVPGGCWLWVQAPRFLPASLWVRPDLFGEAAGKQGSAGVPTIAPGG